MSLPQAPAAFAAARAGVSHAKGQAMMKSAIEYAARAMVQATALNAAAQACFEARPF